MLIDVAVPWYKNREKAQQVEIKRYQTLQGKSEKCTIVQAVLESY